MLPVYDSIASWLLYCDCNLHSYEYAGWYIAIHLVVIVFIQCSFKALRSWSLSDHASYYIMLINVSDHTSTWTSFFPFVQWLEHLTMQCLISSVSNGSGIPGFGPGWNRPAGPGPGHEPPSYLTGSVLAGLLPGPDINPRFFGRVEPGPRFQIAVPATVAPSKYSSSDRITI